jgi:ketosteroid isomerase-like protein
MALASAGGAAWAADPALEAPVRTFLDSLNRGDVAAAATAYASGAISIVDEVPPYYWTSFPAWAAALDKEIKDGGLSDVKVSITGPAVREEVTGDRAYLIMPTSFTFKAGGTAMREDAQMTFVLARESGGWKIASWTWTGPKATPVK